MKNIIDIWANYTAWDYTDAENLNFIPEAKMHLHGLFYSLAQTTQYFPSDDYDGNTTNTDQVYWEDFTNDAIWPQDIASWNDPSDWFLCPVLVPPATIVFVPVEDKYIENTNLGKMGEVLIPRAIQYVAALYKIFWLEFHAAIEGPSVVESLSTNTFKVMAKAGSDIEWDFNYDGVNFNPQLAYDDMQTVTPNPLYFKGATTKIIAVRTTAPGQDPVITTKDIVVKPRPIYVDYHNDNPASHQITFSTPTSSYINQYTWNFGDTKPTESDDDLNEVKHEYDNSDYYRITLTLNLTDGTQLTSTKEMYVGPGTRYILGHTIYDDEIWYHGGTYVVMGQITVGQGATLTIEPGVVVKFGDRCGLTVNGTLDARGTDDQQIVFTSVWDDTYGGNTDPSGGDHTAPGDRWQICPECYGDGTCAWAANYWGQMVFGPTSVNSVVDRAVILYGGSLRS